MSAALTRRLIPLVKAHPRVSGSVLLLAGVFMTHDGIEQGRKYAPFRGGEIAEGRVESVQEAPGQRPPMVASIAIETRGQTVSEQIPLSLRESRKVGVGSVIEMVRATDGSSRFVRRSSLKSAALVAIGGRTIAGIAFFGAVMVLFALWLIALPWTRPET